MLFYCSGPGNTGTSSATAKTEVCVNNCIVIRRNFYYFFQSLSIISNNNNINYGALYFQEAVEPLFSRALVESYYIRGKLMVKLDFSNGIFRGGLGPAA